MEEVRVKKEDVVREAIEKEGLVDEVEKVEAVETVEEVSGEAFIVEGEGLGEVTIDRFVLPSCLS